MKRCPRRRPARLPAPTRSPHAGGQRSSRTRSRRGRGGWRSKRPMIGAAAPLESNRPARQNAPPMISRDFLRKEFERLPHLFRQRNLPPGALESWRAIDEERRTQITLMETARAERNSLSQKIGARRKAGEDSAAEEQRSRTIAAQISSFEENIKKLDARFDPIEA